MRAEEYPGFRTLHDVQYEAAMFALGRLFRPRRILELGTHLGRSLVWYTLGAARTALVVSVDNQSHTPASQIIAEEALRDYGYRGEAVFLAGRTDAGWVREAVRRHSYDFAHVDAEHTYPACHADLGFAWEVLEPGGVIVVHDYAMPEIKAAVDAFAAGCACGVLLLPPDRFLHGLAVIQKPKGGAL